MIGRAIIACVALCAATPGVALSLAECDRTTHISHGGESDHRDLGAARVMWTGWWSQEGVAEDLYIADCDTHQMLITRTKEQNVKDRWFDRTDAAMDVIDLHLARGPVFFSLTGLERELTFTGEDLRIEPMTAEWCACAAAYPDLRGDLAAFTLN